MGRRAAAFAEDDVARAIRAAKKAGIDVKSIRVEPNGAVVINGDSVEKSERAIERSQKAHF
jgi:hypothetical protein